MDSHHARILRFEVRPKSGVSDPAASSLMRRAAVLGIDLADARSADVYLVQGRLSDAQADRVARSLLADPVTQTVARGADPSTPNWCIVEIHPRPGVMDPAAQTVQSAIRAMIGADTAVTTGRRFDLAGVSADQARELAVRVLANPVVHAVHDKPFHPDRFSEPRHAVFSGARSVEIRGLNDEQLERLSRDGHLFLSLDEMQAIRNEFRRLGREPTDIELETLAQTWSEHCVHKTLKSTVRYRATNTNPPNTRPDAHHPHSFVVPGLDDPTRERPGLTANPDGSVTIANLLKSTVAAATHELIDGGIDWALSVFKDNSGVVAFDDTHAVCIKVETHNHPSAIEPYGGAATGIGGCIRDVIGTGLGARPIANTDVFCVAFPDRWRLHEAADGRPLPVGCLHPRRILTDVVAGVRDYGNRMGIPTVNGAVYFEDRYVGNPLVFCGCVGVMPRHMIRGEAHTGDLIVALGGRTGRDGIHGATFSSAEIEHSASDEFSHAVQIGNAIEEKRLLDAILRARDYRRDDAAAAGDHPDQNGSIHTSQCLYHAITDCGAGGFSSAVGEMGHSIGAEVHLDAAPLKYDGLSYTEIWISEAQERMVLAVPEHNLAALTEICHEEGVGLAVLGRFGTEQRELVLHFQGVEVGRLTMDFLHDGVPTPIREAVWSAPHQQSTTSSGAPASPDRRPRPATVMAALLDVITHPNIASKHWIVRQYDHEVRGNTVIKPMVGEAGRGPGDASVVQPVAGSQAAIAIGCGLQTGISDPYLMALAAVDECVRNVVCVGGDPRRTAILDNFCWPSCRKPENMGSLVRASVGCYDAAIAYGTPFVSGKDSLNNQFTTEDGVTIEIRPTLLITGMAHVPDIDRCVTMDAKRPGNVLILVGHTERAMGGSHYRLMFDDPEVGHDPPITDLELGPRVARRVFDLIQHPDAPRVVSVHDVSDGGLLVAVAEMLIAGATQETPIGAQIDLSWAHRDPRVAAFSESPSRFVLEVEADKLEEVIEALSDVPHAVLGTLDDSGLLRIVDDGESSVEVLTQRWMAPLDW